MSKSTDPQTRATPKRQDLRTQLGAVNNSLDELHRSLDNLINETNNRLDELNRSLDNLINETNDRLDELHRSLSEQIRALQKSMDTYFLWMMGMLVTMTGVLIAVIKL